MSEADVLQFLERVVHKELRIQIDFDSLGYTVIVMRYWNKEYFVKDTLLEALEAAEKWILSGGVEEWSEARKYE